MVSRSEMMLSWDTFFLSDSVILCLKLKLSAHLHQVVISVNTNLSKLEMASDFDTVKITGQIRKISFHCDPFDHS